MKLKTFIKWSGNKSKQLRYILPHIPKDYNTYIEPFVGSGALLLKLQPNKWVINDINKDIINIWEEIRDNIEDIIYIFKEFEKIFKPLGNNEKKQFCKEIISKLNCMKYDINRACIYLLMKFCSYMGEIIRNNRFYFNGLDLNIYVNNRYSFLENKYFINLRAVNEFLNKNNGKIMNTEYKNILKTAKKGDFVFLDPPYIDGYTHRYNIDQKLDIDFITDLYKEMKKLDNKGVKWVMTQADTKQVKSIFKDYTIIEYPVYRRYQDKYTYELLIKNF